MLIPRVENLIHAGVNHVELSNHDVSCRVVILFPGFGNYRQSGANPKIRATSTDEYFDKGDAAIQGTTPFLNYYIFGRFFFTDAKLGTKMID